MMKKIWMGFILVGLLLITGCNKNTTPKVDPLVAAEDCQVATLEGNWVCTWADEFEGDTVDETKWTYEINGSGGGNQELQYYIRENTTVADSILTITAKKESYLTRNYTSSRIRTLYKADFLYGRFQIRAKNPVGRGTWPAVWMMPSQSLYGGWPKSGEIDIMEYVGYDPNYTHHTIHTEDLNHNLGTQVGKSYYLPDNNQEFHVYELEWNPGELIFYVDGVSVFQFRYVPGLNQNVKYHEVFPFDQKFYMILNLAVGGTWGGSQGVDDSIFPTNFQIDYVRYYQRDYGVIDKEAPEQVTGITLATLPNTFYWEKTPDNYLVNYYEVYINGEYYDDANVNQYTYDKAIKDVRYTIELVAVDFAGNRGPKSSKFTFDGE